MKSDLIDIHCHLMAETPKAWRLDFGTAKVWIPKSQAELELGTKNLHLCTMPEWLAKEKGLI